MIIISPSGKFYGSEQVLFDYLTNSNVNYSIFVAEKDLFYTKLKKTTRFKDVTSFSNIRVLYFKMLLFCIFSKVKTIYINEAGHNKYIILLAKLFPESDSLFIYAYLRIQVSRDGQVTFQKTLQFSLFQSM